MTIDGSQSVGDVTVNLEGLWLLQAIMGVSTLAPELRTLPYGAARDNEWLKTHPGVEVLRNEGLVDSDGQVRDELAKRLQVLAVPDVEVAILISQGPMNWTPVMDLEDPGTWRAIRAEQLRIVLARRDGQWVSAARAGSEVTIDAVAGGGADWLAGVVTSVLDALHPCGPSRIPALNVPMDDIIEIATTRAATSTADPRRDAPLRELGLRGGALAEVAAVLDEPLVEAVLYARAYTDTEVRNGVAALNLRDTDGGRIAIYRMAAVRGSEKAWMTVAPATATQVEQALQTVLSSVDVPSWDTHRRM